MDQLLKVANPAKYVSSKLEAYARELEVRAFEDKSLSIQAVVIKTEKYMVKVSGGPLNKKNPW